MSRWVDDSRAPKSGRAAARKHYQRFTRCRASGLSAQYHRADLQLEAPGRPGQIYNARPAARCRRAQKFGFCCVLGFTVVRQVRWKRLLSSLEALLRMRYVVKRLIRGLRVNHKSGEDRDDDQ